MPGYHGVAVQAGIGRALDFPARAGAIANEIQAKKPDLIGLQEVTNWTTEGFNPPPSYDFLAILEGALAARGLDYEVAAVAHNAKIGRRRWLARQAPAPSSKQGNSAAP